MTIDVSIVFKTQSGFEYIRKEETILVNINLVLTTFKSLLIPMEDIHSMA